MGKDGAGGLGAYDDTSRVQRVTVTPNSVFLIIADNGEMYSDYRDWPCFFVDTEEQAKLFVENVGNEIVRLYDEAIAHHEKTDYKYFFEQTAPGKRYMKFLKQQGIISKDEKYGQSRFGLRYQKVERRTVG